MATFTSFAACAAEFTKLANDLRQDQLKAITRAMGEKAQTIAERAASADLGGDPKFSGWAPTLDTQLKTLSDGSTLLMPTRSSAGPWTVAEKGRNRGNAAGFSGPGLNTRTGKTSRNKSGALRKQRVSKGKRWNGYTDAKHTASDAVKLIEAEMPKIAEDGIRKVIIRHFDVT